MKLGINRLRYLLLGITVIISAIIIVISSIMIENNVLKWIIICLGIINEAIVILFVMLLKKQVNDSYEKLSITIQSMLDDKPKNIFSELEDTILSKLQYQITKLTKILKRQKEKKAREKEHLDSLISDISHQLKTPLSNLKLYHEMLQDDTLPVDKQIKFHKKIGEQLTKLGWLMEALIKMSKVESGVIQINKKEKSINETIIKAIDMARLKAEHKQIEILFDYENDYIMPHDVNWTFEAIFNIIDNAIKYSPENSKIAIDTMKMDLFIRINIHDEGIGIAEKEYTEVFKRFYRSSQTNNHEGVGIGLYIAREIIVKQGGYILIDSKSEEGSLFSIYLPYRKVL